MHGRCEVSNPEMSVADSDVKLILRSGTAALKVAENCWTCFQHLHHAPSTVLPAGSMKVQVELLHRIRARTTASGFRAGSFVPIY